MGKVYLRDIEGAEQYRDRWDLLADFLAMANGTLVGCELRRLSADGSVELRSSASDQDYSTLVIDLPALTLVGPIAVFR